MRNFTWPVFVAASLCALGAIPKVDPKISVSESIRHESLTVTESFGSSSSSETRSVTVGKMTLRAEVPLTVDPKLDPSTPVSIKVGNFSFSGALRDDPKYQVGRNQARLSQREGSPGSTIRTVNGTVNLKWDASKLTVEVESKSALAAGNYIDNVPGEAKGEITGIIEIAAQKVEFNVPFAAKIRRKTASAGNSHGQVVTIDLKGRL